MSVSVGHSSTSSSSSSSDRRDGRVQDRLARYDERGQLTCVVCKVVLRSDALWGAHCESSGHLDRVALLRVALQKKQQQQQQEQPQPMAPASAPSRLQASHPSIPTVAASHVPPAPTPAPSSVASAFGGYGDDSEEEEEEEEAEAEAGRGKATKGMAGEGRVEEEEEEEEDEDVEVPDDYMGDPDAYIAAVLAQRRQARSAQTVPSFPTSSSSSSSSSSSTASARGSPAEAKEAEEEEATLVSFMDEDGTEWTFDADDNLIPVTTSVLEHSLGLPAWYDPALADVSTPASDLAAAAPQAAAAAAARQRAAAAAVLPAGFFDSAAARSAAISAVAQAEESQVLDQFGRSDSLVAAVASSSSEPSASVPSAEEMLRAHEAFDRMIAETTREIGRKTEFSVKELAAARAREAAEEEETVERGLFALRRSVALQRRSRLDDSIALAPPSSALSSEAVSADVSRREADDEADLEQKTRAKRLHTATAPSAASSRPPPPAAKHTDKDKTGQGERERKKELEHEEEDDFDADALIGWRSIG